MNFDVGGAASCSAINSVDNPELHLRKNVKSANKCMNSRSSGQIYLEQKTSPVIAAPECNVSRRIHKNWILELRPNHAACVTVGFARTLPMPKRVVSLVFGSLLIRDGLRSALAKISAQTETSEYPTGGSQVSSGL